MNPIVLLDAGVIGLLTTPPGRSSDAAACARWLADMTRAKRRVIVPEITDYEVRRELLRLNKKRAIRLLDGLAAGTEYLPISTPAMRRAAELWAAARQAGQPTAGDRTIDADMILAGQALTLGATPVIIATTNVGHLARFVPAEVWQNIPVS